MSNIIEPPWLIEARKHIGQTEIKGPKHNPFIAGLWKIIGLAGIKDDETPWCAAFVGAMLENVGIKSPRSGRAQSFMSWGDSVPAPFVGAIVVFTRDGGGHVGIVIGKDARGNLMVLGGNQSDMVKISAFPHSRVTGYRKPVGYLVPAANYRLPVLAGDGKLSTNEA